MTTTDTIDIVALAREKNERAADRPTADRMASEAKTIHTPKSRPRIKKLDPSLRRTTPTHADEPWHRRWWLLLRDDSQVLRSSVQGTFVLLCIWIGIEFALFVQWGMSGGAAGTPSRPPGVEGFLPISALMSLKYWLLTGVVNTIHPSGLFILLAILSSGFFLKKAFCGWLCPIGTLSESLWMAGERLFGRTWTLPRWADIPLRSLKYLLMAFFVWAIAGMDAEDLRLFIESPYNKMADVKMFDFFAHITPFALWSILILAGLSVVVKNFWCRYLCPYGAMLGLTSMLSPLKITRAGSTCIDCALCTKACPSSIMVHAATRVMSDECMACMRCVEVCPVKDTLTMSLPGAKRASVPGWMFGLLVMGAFVGITGLAMLTGHWQNSISQEEYQKRFQNLTTPVYQHNRGSVAPYGPND